MDTKMAWIALGTIALLGVLAWALTRRRDNAGSGRKADAPAPLAHPPRMNDDPSDNLGRRKDDNVGGEN